MSKRQTSKTAQGFALWRSAMRWQRMVDASLAPIGLTHAQYLVLESTARCQQATGDAVTQRAIAEAAGLDEATTSAVARKLDERGLLDRSPAFGRPAWRVIVTRKGQRLLQRAAPLLSGVARRFFAEGA